MTILIDHESSVTTAGGGAITPAASDRSTSLATCNTGGAEAVVEPPKLDEKPAEVRSDVTLDEIFDFDLKPLGEDDEDDSEPRPFASARRLVCSTSSDGQTTIHRFGSVGIVLTAAETRQVYEFLSDSARIWGAAL